MKNTRASQFHCDPQTGQITALAETGVDMTHRSQNITTYRRPKTTAPTGRKPRGQRHPETKRHRTPEENRLTWQGHNGTAKWEKGLKARHGTNITRTGQTGTGGNAVGAIPTGPLNPHHGTRNISGNPTLTVKYHKWENYLQRAEIAARRGKISTTALNQLRDQMNLNRHNRGTVREQPGTLVIHITHMTERELKSINSTRIPKRSR